MQIYTVHIYTCAHVCSVNVHGISFHSLAHLYVCVQNVHVYTTITRIVYANIELTE